MQILQKPRFTSHLAAGQSRRAAVLLIFLSIVLCAITIGPGTARAASLLAGDYTFSDELGGFTITGVSGTGSRDDPVIIHQILTHTEPVTMVIRRSQTAATPKSLVGSGRWVAVHLKIIIQNQSRRVWQGFEVELQEILNKPSIRQDGLSFDQGALVPAAIVSNRFGLTNRLFEPYDRIKFLEGHVNPLDFVDFKMHITDPTPVNTFYLLLDPQILYSFRLVVPGENTQG